MPIIFISLNEEFNAKMKQHGFEVKNMKIQDYVPNPTKKTYYVSPANKVKTIVKKLNIVSIVGKPYLPIGSSIILDKGDKALVVSPTMLLPQNVSTTQNAYFATMAVLHNILCNRNENLENVDILLTSFCCGYGKMSEEESVQQMLKGIQDHAEYKPTRLHTDIVIHEPNLCEQPKYYQNTEFFHINPEHIVRC